MCGIAGWVDFATDLRSERETAEAMTASMSLRGPDAGGTWLSPHAAIGHRRLAVIDPAGGTQPMVSGDTVLTYSGEVYNFRELRTELRSAGYHFHTTSDTEVVLRAYEHWGVDMVDRLNGIYAFAIWDGAAEELVLVRDRMGVKPLYTYETPNGLLFGSEPKAILANPQAKRVIDPTGLTAFMILSANMAGHTPFRGLLEVQPGEILRFSRKGLQRRRYWRLEAKPHEDDLPTTVATVRELLEDIVSRQLVSDVPLCMLLSGGLDSSVLTALAKKTVNGNGGLRSFSVDFNGHDDSFEADQLRGSHDQPFVHEMVRHLGVEHRDIVLDTKQLCDETTRKSVLNAWDLPNHMGDMDVSLYLLFEAIREHSTVAISGESADEVFGGYPWVHDKAALEIPIYPWIGFQAGKGTPAPFSLFDPELIQKLGVWEYLGGVYSDAIAEAPRLEGEDAEQARMREVTYLDMTRFVRGMLDRKDRTSMAVGLEVRVPFCDHRLVEYVFNTPWAMKNHDGREKSLLRAASEDLLPESVLQRPKSAFPATVDTRYDDMLCAELAQIVDGDDAMSPSAPSSTSTPPARWSPAATRPAAAPGAGSGPKAWFAPTPGSRNTSST